MIAMLGVVDTAVAGRMSGVVFLAAVGLASAFAHFVFWLFGFLRMGTTGITAQALGRKDARGVRLSLLRGASFGLALGLLLLLLSPLLYLLAVKVYVQQENLAEPFLQYLRIRFIGAPFALVTYAFYGWFLGVDRNHLMLLIQTIVIVANIILSPALALGLGWGVEGIAWATVISEALGAGLALIYVLRVLPRLALKPLRVALRVADIFDVVEIWRFLSINTHIFLRTLCMLLAFQVFWVLSADLGIVALSVNTILLQMLNIAAFALDGFALAGEAMVGENFTRFAGKKQASVVIGKVVESVLAWSCAFALLFTIVYALTFDLIIAGFTNLQVVREAAREYRWWAALVPSVGVWAYAWDGIFLGLTLTKAFMLGTIFASLIFVIVAIPLVELLGNDGLWLALYIFFSLRALSLYAFWRRWWTQNFAKNSPKIRLVDKRKNR